MLAPGRSGEVMQRWICQQQHNCNLMSAGKNQDVEEKEKDEVADEIVYYLRVNWLLGGIATPCFTTVGATNIIYPFIWLKNTERRIDNEKNILDSALRLGIWFLDDVCVM